MKSFIIFVIHLESALSQIIFPDQVAALLNKTLTEDNEPKNKTTEVEILKEINTCFANYPYEFKNGSLCCETPVHENGFCEKQNKQANKSPFTYCPYFKGCDDCKFFRGQTISYNPMGFFKLRNPVRQKFVSIDFILLY